MYVQNTEFEHQKKHQRMMQKNNSQEVHNTIENKNQKELMKSKAGSQGTFQNTLSLQLAESKVIKMPQYNSEVNALQNAKVGALSLNERNSEDSATLLSNGFLQTPENSEPLLPMETSSTPSYKNFLSLSKFQQKASPEQKALLPSKA